MSARKPFSAESIWGRSAFVVLLCVAAIMLQPAVGRLGICHQFRLCASFCHAQEKEAGALQKPYWPHEESDLAPDADINFGKLANGFRYLLLKNQKPEKRVSMHLYIQIGSMHEKENEKGAAHFLEHMLFNGSEHFAPGELVKYFQRIGMQFGPDANAHTGFFETVYDILLPSGDERSIAEGMLVIKDYAQGALLIPDEIERERKVVLAEMRTRDSVSYRTFVATLNFEYPDTRLPARLPIGEESVLVEIDRKILKGFYDAWYRPENMILVMVGDLEIPACKALIEESFAQMAARAKKRPDYQFGELHHKGLKTFYHYEKESGGTKVSIETLNPIGRKPDSFALQKKTLVEFIANRIVQDRLDAMLKAGDCPFTSAAIGSGTLFNQVAYTQITADSSPSNWEKTLQRLETTLRKALIFGFNQTELERVKKDFKAYFENAVKEAATRDSREIARSILRTLRAERVFQSPRQEKELYLPVIEETTLKMAHEAFKRLWQADHRLIMVTGNAEIEGAKEGPQKSIARVYWQSNKLAVTGPPKREPAQFPYLPDPVDKGVISKRITIDDLNIIQIDYNNGLRLNLKKTALKDNQVLVNLTFKGGRSVEPQQLPGLARLSQAVVNESGLGRMDQDELEYALAGKYSDVTFEIWENRFVYKGETVPEELSLFFQLLYAKLKDPGFRMNSYRLAMQRFDQRYKSLQASVDGAILLQGENFLGGGDSRFGMPPQSRFKELTLDMVRAWIRTNLSQASMELSVVGDFDPEEVIGLSTRYLGGWTAKDARQPLVRNDQPRFPQGEKLHLRVATKIPKALVVVTWPTTDFWNIQRTRRFSVLAEILSERLRNRVREKLGASYSPFAFSRNSRVYPNYGYLQALVNVDPKETEKVITEIRAIADGIIARGIAKDEHKRALAPTISSIRDLRQSNQYWLNNVLTGSLQHPEQIQWSRTMESDFAAISPEEIHTLAKKYLINRRAAVIIIQPE
jgi:zinc protease